MSLIKWIYGAVFSFLLSGAVSAADGEISCTTHSYIRTSEQGKELEGTVEVSFRIDATGKVEILHINATSPQLADYVIKKLNRIQLEKGDPQIGQVIKYRFVFKKQA